MRRLAFCCVFKKIVQLYNKIYAWINNSKNLLNARAMLSNTGWTAEQSSLPGCVFAVNVVLGLNINHAGAPSSDQTGGGDVADDSVGYDGIITTIPILREIKILPQYCRRGWIRKKHISIII